MEFIRNSVNWFTGNYILNVSVTAFLTAQVIKIIIELSVHRKKITFSRLTGSGGMPSSHSATVVALATSVYRVRGYDSTDFAIAAILAIIVMYDALNIRRAAGEHAKRINFIMQSLSEVTPETFQRQLKELLGHTPLQVVMGALLGLALGLLM
ncbi:MAG: divergent PAP2 family protein [Oscillospiraceae bacterium]|nr:divergent PAP2 family protein [Oscillospiraceae bacterium]